MERQDIRDKMCECGYEDSIVYDCPSFDESIIGVDHQGRTVYSFDLMVDEFVRDDVDDMSTLTEEEYYDKREEAIEFIEYNTIRATPYMGSGGPVIVAYNPEEEEYYDMVRDEKFEIDDLDTKLRDLPLEED